jgi:hypothetical protein
LLFCGKMFQNSFRKISGLWQPSNQCSRMSKVMAQPG